MGIKATLHTFLEISGWLERNKLTLRMGRNAHGAWAEISRGGRTVAHASGASDAVEAFVSARDLLGDV